MKNKILNYYQSMNSKEQQNEYLKSVAFPQNFLIRKEERLLRELQTKYFAQFWDENNRNLIIRKSLQNRFFDTSQN